MVAFFSGLCRQAGLPCEVEPRDFQTYKCQVCARSFKTLADHPASCRGNPLRSGPDLAISWPTGDIFYDYTTVHEMSPSNVGTAVTTLAAQKVEQKVRKYTGTTANPGPLTVDNFVPLPAYSLGGLHKNTRALLADLAAVMGVSPFALFADFGSTLQQAQAATLCRLFPRRRPAQPQPVQAAAT